MELRDWNFSDEFINDTGGTSQSGKPSGVNKIIIQAI